MRILSSTGREDIAMVYIAEMEGGRLLECVEAVQPPLGREEKWVLLISTMFGCPIRCQMCDAGGHYRGKASAQEILAQIDFLVQKRYPGGDIPSRQFKIQFSRMGEPALNPAVLSVLEALPGRYRAPGLMPSLSTIAPRGTSEFFERLLQVKRVYYSGGHFQFQFSIHTTEEGLRNRLIPARKWNFAEMAAYGERFFQEGDRKITLNFALADGMPVEPAVLLAHFSPEKYLVKITPLNPTYQSRKYELSTYIDPERLDGEYRLVQALRRAGYEVIVSIGEVEENRIGSNCGQQVIRHLRQLAAGEPIRDGYTYRPLGELPG